MHAGVAQDINHLCESILLLMSQRYGTQMLK